jgi:hypothetical protein
MLDDHAVLDILGCKLAVFKSVLCANISGCFANDRSNHVELCLSSGTSNFEYFSWHRLNVSYMHLPRILEQARGSRVEQGEDKKKTTTKIDTQQ